MPFKTLIVDDDVAICEVISAAIAPLDCEVVTANTGADALEQINRHSFAVIILDISLPDMDGIEILRHIRRHRPEAEVIILTGHASLESATEAVRLGAYDYITKPAPVATIRATVRRALERQRLTTRLATLTSLISETTLFTSVEQIGQAALTAIGQVLRFDICGLWVVEEEQNALRRVVYCYYAPSAPDILPLDGDKGIVVAAARSGQMVYVPDVREDPRYVVSLPTCRSELAVPLKVRGRVIGVLNVESEELDAFDVDDVQLLSALASQIAVALENVRLHREHIQERDRLRTILQNMPVLLVALDDKGNIVAWNQECERVTGYTADEVIGCRHIAKRLFPDRQYRRQLIKHWRQVRNDFLDWEMDIVTKSGAVRTISLSSISDRFPVPGWHTWAVGVDVTEQKELIKGIERWTARLDALRQVGLQITSQLNRDELLHSIVSYAVELLDGTSGGLYLHRPDKDALEWVVAVGDDLPPIGSLIRSGEGLSGKVWQAGRAMKVDNYQEWEGRAEQHRDLPWTAVIGAPVHWHGDFLGVVVVTSSAESRLFVEADMELLSLFAVQSAIAIKNASLHREARLREQELDAVNRAIRSMTSHLDLDTVLQIVLTEAGTAVQAEATSVLLYDDQADRLWFAASVGQGAERVRTLDMPADKGVAGWAVREQRPALVHNAQEDARFYSRIDDITGLSTKSLIAVPMVHRDKVIGVIEAVNKTDGDFNARDLRLLTMLADSAAIAIDNAHLHTELQRRLAEVRVLHAVTVAASSTLDLDQILERTAEAIRRALNVEYLVFALPDESGESLVIHHSLLGEDTDLVECASTQMKESLCGQVYLTGEPALIGDVQALPHPFEISENLRSLLVVPVRQRGERVIAVLAAGRPQPNAFSADDQRLFEAIAAQLGIAMENAHLHEAEREHRKLVEQSRAQLIQSEKLAATGRMAASLAHEINNPLQAIHNSLQLVLSFPLSPEEQREYLQIASEEIERLVGMVKRMLQFARRPQDGMKQVQVNTVVERVLSLAHKYLQHHHISLRRDLTPDLPLVLGNPDELEQVFLNIVLNGVDAMPDGGTLRVVSSTTDDGRIAVSISDTGVGIPPENLPRIFEMFFSTKENGTGLGLSISHNIIERHNGEIAVQSEVGKGTTFTVYLPAMGR